MFYIPSKPRWNVLSLRGKIYEVLRSNYPWKMSASQIAEELNNRKNCFFISSETITKRQVEYAIRYYALKSKHFAVFPINGRVRYSVYLLEPPYDPYSE